MIAVLHPLTRPGAPELTVVMPFMHCDLWLMEALVSVERAAAGSHWQLLAVDDAPSASLQPQRRAWW